MPRPRLMHIVAGLGTGGTEMMCLRLARHWQDGFEQSVISWSTESRTLEVEFRSIPNLTLTIAPSPQNAIQRWIWLRRCIREHSPDALLIHVFGSPHLVAAHAARVAGVRTIAAIAGNPPPQMTRARRRWSAILIASRLLRCPVVSCSRTVDRELRGLGVGMPAGSVPIYNAIDVDHIAQCAAAARRVRLRSAPVIGMIARLNEIKDHKTLLCAFALLQQEHPGAELWIIGEGPLRRALEAQAAALGIFRSTRFLGERADVSRLLGEIDVFAFSTTHDEGFGIALIEAMAAGVPIVATDVPACREVLAGGDAGILVPPRNPEALALALSELLKSNERCTQLVNAARDRVARKYSIGVYAKWWERTILQNTNFDVKMDWKCAS